MKKTMKKILCSLLVVFMCLTAAPLKGFVGFDWGWLDFSVNASALATTGQCGENVFWNYNSETGELVISGTGDMWDYIYSSSAPFTDNTIRRVIIEDGVTSIGTHVFYYGSFSYISIPSSVKTIKDFAFGYCHNLEYIIIPNGVEYIGIQSIYSCGNLKEIYISATVKSFEFGALSGNVNLEKIIVDKNSNYYCNDENGVLFTKDKSTLVQYTLGSKCESYTIPNGVKTIANASFENAHNLIDVIIPDGVVSIEDRAFDFCSNLISVDIAGSVKNIGADIFRGCYKLNDIILGDGITKIGSVIFESCNFTKIFLPESVTTIGYWAFGYCHNLKEINFPESLTEIEGYAFRDCDSLKNVILYNVKTIGEAAFLSCDSLEKVILSEGLEKIDTFTFRWCGALKNIVIPASVKTIGSWAFELCSNLENVYYTGTEEQWKKIKVDSYNEDLLNATIHYNYVSPVTSNSNFNVKNPLEPTFIITPQAIDKGFGINKNLSTVKAITNIGSRTFNEFVEIEREKVVDENGQHGGKIVIMADGYRHYVIPNEVVKSIQPSPELNNLYPKKVYMQSAEAYGKAYISTVFARKTTDDNSNEYVDISTIELATSKGEKHDFIISVAGLNSGETVEKYVLMQNEKAKFENNTGVFKSKDLYSKFEEGKQVYAYAVTSTGRKTDTLKVKVEIVNSEIIDEGFDNALSINLFGSGAQKVSLDSDIPFLKDAYISLDAFKCPIGMEIEGDKVRVTLGFDGFSGSKKAGKKFEWDSFKKSVNSQLTLLGDGVIESDKKKPKSFDDALNKFDKIKEKYADKDQLAKIKKKSKTSFDFDTSFLGYIEAEIVDGQFIYTDVQGVVAVSAKVGHTWPFAILGFPVYASLTGGADGNAKFSKSREVATPEMPMEFGCVLSLEPFIKGAFGAGIEDLAYAELNAKGSAPVAFDTVEKHLTLSLAATIGWKAGLWILETGGEIWSGDKQLIDNYFGVKSKMLMRSFEMDYPDVVESEPNPQIQVMSRDYTDNTSEWLYGAPSVSLFSLRSVQQGVTFADLQTSVFAGSQIKTVQVGDNTVAAWIEDDVTRDTYNRMRLVYSVRNGDTGLWSEPTPVWDNGMNDGYPSISESNGKVYITWQKINKVLTESDCTSTDAFYTNGEICLAEYDIEQDKIVSAELITGNDYYDFSPTVIVNNDSPVVYWASCSENNMNEADSCKIERFSDGKTSVVKDNINCPSNIEVGIKENKESLSYCADVDGDIETTSDITVTTILDGKESIFDKCENDLAITSVKYGKLDNESVVFMHDSRNIYYQDTEGVKEVFETDRIIEGNFNVVNAVNGTQLLWTETAENGTNQIFSCVYSDGVWSIPVQITNNDKYITNLNAVSANGKIIGICNRTNLSYDESSDEYIKGQTDICSFTTEDLTDLEIEFYDYSEQNFLEGDNTFEVIVRNYGTTDIDEIEFIVSDSLGNSSTVIKDVNLKSGSTDYIELEYVSDDTYSKATVTVTANVVNDDEAENNTTSFEVGKPDISLSYDTVVEYDEYYDISVNISDISLINAENVELSVSSDESGNEKLFTESIGSVESSEIKSVDISLKKDALVFDEFGAARVYIKARSNDEESTTVNNSICVLLTIADDLICEHALTEVVNAVNASCEANGFSGDVICIGCGETISEGEVIEATGHSYESVVTKPSCTESGFTTYTCSVCNNSYTTDVVTNLGHNLNYIINIEPSCNQQGYRLSECLRCGVCEENQVTSTGHTDENEDGYCDVCYDSSCDCICHKTGLVGIIWKIFKVILKSFNANSICSCGQAHY